MKNTTFYRVKLEYDGKRILKLTPPRRWEGELYRYELITRSVYKRLIETTNIRPEYFDKIRIPREMTYYFFGRRFALDSE